MVLLVPALWHPSLKFARKKNLFAWWFPLCHLLRRFWKIAHCKYCKITPNRMGIWMNFLHHFIISEYRYADWQPLTASWTWTVFGVHQGSILTMLPYKSGLFIYLFMTRINNTAQNNVTLLRRSTEG